MLQYCLESGWLEPGTDFMAGVARRGIRVGSYDDPAWISLQCRVLPMPEFLETGSYPAVRDVLTRLFDGPILPNRGDTCRVFSPEAADLTTLPHQDHYYVRGSTSLWTVWLPVGDCPMELGGLAVLPGSHREGLREHDGEGSGKQGVTVPEDTLWHTENYLCGDVLMFHCLTLHQALQNRSVDRLRVSVDYRFEPAGDADQLAFDDLRLLGTPDW